MGIYDKLKCFVIFVGYPRSGHSLVGSILDAHPHMAIAHEFNLLEHLLNYQGTDLKNDILQAILKNTEIHAGRRIQTSYDYTIPNQYQGRYAGEAHVIGDKKGGKSTLLFSRDAELYRTVLSRFLDELSLPLKIIHVVRNPFDNIATMAIRDFLRREQSYSAMKVSAITPLDIPNLHKSIRTYSLLVKENANLHSYNLGDINTLYSENFLANPRREIHQLVNFLGENVTQKYLKDCCSIVMKKPRNTRRFIKWSEKNLNAVTKLIDDEPLLHRYRSDDAFHFYQ